MIQLKKKYYGKTKEGQDVYIFKLVNKQGNIVVLTNYGVNIISILLNDKNGQKRDVVLGYDYLSEYEDNHPMFGATVGRNVNRIENAKFTIDGQTYTLVKNRGNHNIHSDKEKGFHKVVWEYEILDNQSITFSYTSPDMDQGFPGVLKTSITYAFTDVNSLIVTYRSISDKKTLINLTNHSYFNLGGHDNGTILNTKVNIYSDEFTPVNNELIPTGEIKCVDNTPMDFRTSKSIEDMMTFNDDQIQKANGYDHNYVIKHPNIGLRKIAEASNEDTGLKMELYSDLPGMQFYTGNSLTEIKGKGGVIYKRYSGFCMEPHYFPNSINIEHFESPVFNENEEYKTTTIYQFSCDC